MNLQLVFFVELSTTWRVKDRQRVWESLLRGKSYLIWRRWTRGSSRAIRMYAAVFLIPCRIILPLFFLFELSWFYSIILIMSCILSERSVSYSVKSDDFLNWFSQFHQCYQLDHCFRMTHFLKKTIAVIIYHKAVTQQINNLLRLD